MQSTSRDLGIRRGLPVFFTSTCLVLALLAPGCSREHTAKMRQGAFTRVVTPEPPPFLTGPAALLLTNWEGFSARVEVRTESSTGGERISEGELLGRGSKLLYAPQADENTDTHHQPGGYSFIWDAAQGRGYVLSEALQAYAPAVIKLNVTNLEKVVGGAPAQRLAGHPCETVTVTARLSDYPTRNFELWRAVDLNGFPMRIQTGTNSVPFTLNFSKVRFEVPAANVFAPPDGFSQFASPQAMADELAARQHNLRRKSPGQMQYMPELQPRRY